MSRFFIAYMGSLMLRSIGIAVIAGICSWRIRNVAIRHAVWVMVLAAMVLMPAIVFFLAKMGLVTARFLLVNFKYAFLLIFIAAAVITPSGDAATQALFAAPMVGLYLIGIIIAWVVGPVARRGGDEVSLE